MACLDRLHEPTSAFGINWGVRSDKIHSNSHPNDGKRNPLVMRGWRDGWLVPIGGWRSARLVPIGGWRSARLVPMGGRHDGRLVPVTRRVAIRRFDNNGCGLDRRAIGIDQAQALQVLLALPVHNDKDKLAV